MTRDEEAAEEIAKQHDEWVECTGAIIRGYVGEARYGIIEAFKAGIEHERKRSQVLVDALERVSGASLDATKQNCQYWANDALKQYGTQSDEVGVNVKAYGPEAEVGKCRDCGNWVSLPHECPSEKA